jgi:hypothetical protein
MEEFGRLRLRWQTNALQQARKARIGAKGLKSCKGPELWQKAVSFFVSAFEEFKNRNPKYGAPIMRKAMRIICATLTLVLVASAAAQVPTMDWTQQTAEILRHNRALVRIDISNPRGNETKAVEYLKKVFD